MNKMLVKQVCFADTVMFAGMCKHVPSVCNFSKQITEKWQKYLLQSHFQPH